MLARQNEGIAEVTVQQEAEAAVQMNLLNASISRHRRQLSAASNASNETDENICPEKVIQSTIFSLFILEQDILLLLVHMYCISRRKRLGNA